MPELPEVETIRRQLAPHLEGTSISSVEVQDPRWCWPAGPAELAAALEGRRIEAVGRRGKYFDFELAGEIHLILHLRMTGNLLFVRECAPVPGPPHMRARIGLGDAGWLLFCDPRRFGTALVVAGDHARDRYFAERLGVEPLEPDFTTGALQALMRGRRAPAKAFLLAQDRIAGIGNIYADEALFRARIHPLRPVGSLRRPKVAALRDAIVEALEAGIDAQGASIDDFRHADGARGSFQELFMVHRREGEPCPRCGTTIVKFRAAGRGTYVCPRCQRRPRAIRPGAPAA